jgi:hypothetical protein
MVSRHTHINFWHGEVLENVQFANQRRSLHGCSAGVANKLSTFTHLHRKRLGVHVRFRAVLNVYRIPSNNKTAIDWVLA